MAGTIEEIRRPPTAGDEVRRREAVRIVPGVGRVTVEVENADPAAVYAVTASALGESQTLALAGRAEITVASIRPVELSIAITRAIGGKAETIRTATVQTLDALILEAGDDAATAALKASMAQDGAAAGLDAAAIEQYTERRRLLAFHAHLRAIATEIGQLDARKAELVAEAAKLRAALGK